MASAGPHLSSTTVGYPVDCPSETQMFRLLGNAAFLGPNPWILAPPRHRYFQTARQHFCVQLCLNICQILSSSDRNLAEEFACDYIVHQQGSVLTCACEATPADRRIQTAWWICGKLQYSDESSNWNWWTVSHVLRHVHAKSSWSRTLVNQSLFFLLALFQQVSAAPFELVKQDKTTDMAYSKYLAVAKGFLMIFLSR